LLSGKALPVIIVLIAGVIIAVLLVASRPEPEMKRKKTRATLVQVMEAQPRQEQIKVLARGTVIPAQELQLSAEVSGRITKVNPKLVPGGYLKKGDLIAKIDNRDYNAVVSQRRAQFKEAETNFKIEEGRQEIARREWEIMNKSLGVSGSSSDLALRKPQLENAKAAVKSARSALYQARLNRGRTVIKAPFNAIVRKKSVDVGQVVTQQTSLATLIGADRYWVQVSVPVSRISLVNLPDSEGEGGARATITHNADGVVVIRKGEVIRLLGDLETSGRMARLLISIDDPLGLNSEEKGLPLLINAYVRVEIEGRGVNDVFVIPRTAIREGDRIWIMDESNRLKVRPVNIIWRRVEDVLIKDGISAGERIITSGIPTPIPGMALRTQGEAAGEDGGRKKPASRKRSDQQGSKP